MQQILINHSNLLDALKFGEKNIRDKALKIKRRKVITKQTKIMPSQFQSVADRTDFPLRVQKKRRKSSLYLLGAKHS